MTLNNINLMKLLDLSQSTIGKSNNNEKGGTIKLADAIISTLIQLLYSKLADNKGSESTLFSRQYDSRKHVASL